MIQNSNSEYMSSIELKNYIWNLSKDLLWYLDRRILWPHVEAEV